MSIEDAYIELRKVNNLRQEAITKLSKENKKLKEKLDKVEEVVLKCIETKYCTDCMFFTGCRRCCKKYILKIIRGEE